MAIDLTNLSNLHALEPLDLALHWASRGCSVLPTNPNTKAPWVGRQWEKQATTDPAVIRGWAAKWQAGARVGIKTGLACGCGCGDGPDVLDFDVSDGKPGIEQLRILVNAGVLDGTRSLRVQTPTGGAHWWFEGTDQHNKQNDDAVWGIDLRAHHGMVLAPGNPGYEVKAVPWESLARVDWVAVAACPGLLQKPAEPGRPVLPPSRPPDLVRHNWGKLVAPTRFDNEIGEESPLDWYCNTTDLGKLLIEDEWTYAYSHDGRDYYARPGKNPKDGISANVMLNADGRQTLMCFSTSVTWLPTDRGLSAAQYLAYRDHGGDMRVTARIIRTTMMPRRQPVQTTGLASPPASAQPVAGMPVGAGPAPGTEGTPSAELVPVAKTETPEPIRAFWQARPELREVWWKSQIGGVSPWAVLGNILANVAARIGPHVALPPLGGVGAPASLNLLVAISGNSGTGKGRSGPIAREFMGKPYPPQRKPGTGQGIAAMFTEQTKEGPVQSNDTVVLNVAEITQLGAHMNQQGATITSTLLEVYMGEELGEHYANKELRRPVRDGAYRLALVCGVQPGNSHLLFDHAESGLPQRFIWLPAFWPDAVLPEGSLRPPAPGSELRRWSCPQSLLPGSLDEMVLEQAWSPSDAADKLKAPGKKQKEPEALPVPIKEPMTVVYAPRVRYAIESDHSRRLNGIKKRLLAGEDDPGDPDSHLLLTRAKVAALLAAWLDGAIYVSDGMWEMAGWVIWISNDTRARAQARLRAKAAERNTTRAMARVAEKAIADEVEDRKHNALSIKVMDRVVAILTKSAQWLTVREIALSLASRDKKAMREAGIDLGDLLADLRAAGKLDHIPAEGPGGKGEQYRVK